MSDIKPIPFDESTAQQRRDYATDFCNLSIDPDDDDNDIIAKISTSQGGVPKFIFVQEIPEAQQGAGQFDTPEPVEGQTILRASGTLGQGDPRAVIMIPTIDSDDGRGNDDVIVGVNGRNWQLKRGVELPVPWRVVEALGLTEQDIVRHKPREDGTGKVDVVTTKAKRFPVQILTAPTAEEIVEWHKVTDNKFCP